MGEWGSWLDLGMATAPLSVAQEGINSESLSLNQRALLRLLLGSGSAEASSSYFFIASYSNKMALNAEGLTLEDMYSGP